MTSQLNLNLNPYYDDFDETKGYYRILFKPGFAVQARELTQLQTQLQNQVSKFGSHIFADGSLVLGGNFFDHSVHYILVSRDNVITNFNNQTFEARTEIQANSYYIGNTTLSIPNLANTNIALGMPLYGVGIDSNTVNTVSNTVVTALNVQSNLITISSAITANANAALNSIYIGGAKGKVVKVEEVTDTVAKVYFDYLNGFSFNKNDTIVCENLNTETVVNDNAYTGYAKAFSIDSSVFFAKKNFVYCNPQTLIIAEDSKANCRVGLVAIESVVDNNSDTTLLDPALGSYNYSAPGADRYSISLELYSYAYDPSIEDASQNASENFIELVRFVNDEKVTVNKLPIYSDIEDTLARRTYDESGDYTVKQFNIKVKEHNYGNTELFSLQIDPGKAYVRGYEFETIAPTYLDLPRAIAFDSIDDFPIYTEYGKYIYVKDISGTIDYVGNDLIRLKNSSSQIIGNAYVKYIDFESRVGSNNIYKLYVDNITLNDQTVNPIGNVTSISVASGTFTANIANSFYNNSVTEVLGNQTSPYILKLSKDFVKTLVPNNISGITTQYTALKKIGDTTFNTNGSNTVGIFTNTSSGSTQVMFGNGDLSDDEIRSNYLITVTSSSDPALPVGTILDPSPSITANIISANLNSEKTELTVIANSTYTIGASLYAKVGLTFAEHKNKTANTANVVLSLTNTKLSKANLANNISLSKSDCVELLSVTANAKSWSTGNFVDLDYTNSFVLNTGQTDTLYDHGYVSLKPGYIDPLTANIANIQSLTISFTYYRQAAGGTGYFCADSYPAAGYDDIPTYVSSSGESFNLRDCIDFRARRDDDATTISGGLLSEPSSLFSCDFQYYLGRIDKLALTKERKLTLIQGIPSEYPTIPVDLPDSMNLYILNVPPYTKNPADISNSFIENRRYTMRDIGKIEKRVDRVEYYTALSLLEKQAADESIPDATTGVERFKNGILVDSFAGHSVGDVANPEYKCSIDYTKKFMRAPFSSQSYNFKAVDGNAYYVKNGDLVTLGYETETFINQPLVSRWVNLNPYNIFKWDGYVELIPSSDTWIDTYTKPDVVINLNGENDIYTVLTNNVENPGYSGVRWGDWQTIVNGVPQTTNSLSTSSALSTKTVDGKTYQTTTSTSINNQTTTVTDELARVGIEISTSSVQTITRDLGTKVVDTSILPYIRSRIVEFHAKGMKPFTKLMAFFDDTDVTAYCSTATEIVLNQKIVDNVERKIVKIIVTNNGTGNPTDVEAKVIGKGRDRNRSKFWGRVNNWNAGLGAGSKRIEAGNTIEIVVEENESTPTTVSYTVEKIVEHTDLITNEKGELAGYFLIPNTDVLKFRTGERVFKLADSSSNPSTAASTKYIAQGYSQSTERTLVSTRIAYTSINPTLETKTVTDRTTQTIAIGTTSTTTDITPPPPKDISLPCSATQTGGKIGRFTYTIDFGTDIGSCGINYNAFSVPDRYTIIWDGNQYSTGFVGSSSYNSQLNAKGFPNVVGAGSGQLRFNKTKASPSTATIIVDAPLSGTGWRFTSVCPNVSSSVTPVPISCYDEFRVVTAQFGPSFSVDATSTTKTLSKSPAVTIFRPNNLPSSVAAVFTLNWEIKKAGVTIGLTGSPTVTLAAGQNSVTTTLGAFTFDYPNTAGTTNGYSITVKPTLNTIGGSAPSASCPAKYKFEGSYTMLLNRTAPATRVDPVAQTFFVEATQYPNGIFLDSIDLYFRNKSQTIPVTVEVRPTVNGYPSSTSILPFSEVSLDPDDVEISDDGSVATNFKFRSPVYLPPGEYCFVAKTNVTDYEIYTAYIGDFQLNTTDLRITEQPAVGSMFKSQNASTWTPIQEEDVKFRLNKCVFDTTNVGSITLQPSIPEANTGDIEYDVFFADGEMLDFADTNINFFVNTTRLTNTQTGEISYQLGNNMNMPQRMHIRNDTPDDLEMRLDLSTADRNISPVVDLQRLSTVLIKNVINNGSLAADDFIMLFSGTGYSGNANVVISAPQESWGTQAYANVVFDAATNSLTRFEITNSGSGYTGNVTATVLRDGTASANATVEVRNEIRPSGGNAIARYITRRVNLASGFESTDLKAYLLGYVPSETYIKVYCKLATVESTFFELEPWREMELESSGNQSESGFVDYKYKLPTASALPEGDRFKTFALKIVMYSNNSVRVPVIRDLRVIALDE